MIPAGRERAKRILITGASGLLGLNFALQAAGDARYAVTGVVHHNELAGVPFSVLQSDLARPRAVAELLELTRPELVIHCAALANLEACEAQPEQAWRLNAGVPGDLAIATAQAGIKLVHISTDAVFDGQRGDYTEEDKPNPLGVYARSKLAGEASCRAGQSTSDHRPGKLLRLEPEWDSQPGRVFLPQSFGR